MTQMTKIQFAKIHRDYRGATDGKYYYLKSTSGGNRMVFVNLIPSKY